MRRTFIASLLIFLFCEAVFIKGQTLEEGSDLLQDDGLKVTWLDKRAARAMGVERQAKLDPSWPHIGLGKRDFRPDPGWVTAGMKRSKPAWPGQVRFGKKASADPTWAVAGFGKRSRIDPNWVNGFGR